MNGAADIKKAAINKAKQAVSNATNSNGGKKRRKGQDLKPIITTESHSSHDDSPTSSASGFNYRYVHGTASLLLVSPYTCITR